MKGKRLWSLAAAVCLLAGSARAARETEAEVPPQMVKGRTLLIPGHTAAAVAPGPYWKWYMLGTTKGDSSAMDIYLCRNAVDVRDFGYVLFVTQDRMSPLDASTLDKFVRGLKSGLGRDDLVLARPSYEPSDIPFPGSYRFRYEIVSSRMTGYLFGYIGRRGHGFITQCVSLSEEEPAEFRKFSASLFARTPPSIPRAVFGLAVSVLAVVLGVVLWVTRRGLD